MSPEGGSKKRFYLIGTDYVYPRTTNKNLRLYLTKTKGVTPAGIREEYTPFHHQDYQTIVGKIRSLCAGGDGAVINIINGVGNVPFFRASRRNLPGDLLQLCRSRTANPGCQTPGQPSRFLELLHVAQIPSELQVGQGAQEVVREARYCGQAARYR